MSSIVKLQTAKRNYLSKPCQNEVKYFLTITNPKFLYEAWLKCSVQTENNAKSFLLLFSSTVLTFY